MLAMTDLEVEVGEHDSSRAARDVLTPAVLARLIEALEVPAAIRVLRRLVELRTLIGHDRIPVRQSDLATTAQTSRATANAVLRQEEGRGTLSLGRAEIRILDRVRLARRAGLVVEADPRYNSPHDVPGGPGIAHRTI
jgi:CRP-like cAMP-binding protein